MLGRSPEHSGRVGWPAGFGLRWFLCDRCIYLRFAEPMLGFLILGKSANSRGHGSVRFLLGLVLRLRGDYLAIVTLGFGEIIRILLNNA